MKHSLSAGLELYVARELARGLAILGGHEFDPAEIEREDDKFARYVADQEECERGYVGPAKERN